MRKRCPFCNFAGNDRKLNKHIPGHRAVRIDVFAKQMGLSTEEVIAKAITLGYPDDARRDMIPENIANRISSRLSKEFFKRLRYCRKCNQEHEGRCATDPNSGVWGKIRREKRSPKLSQGGHPSLGKRRP
jgi:hypothetical protein